MHQQRSSNSIHKLRFRAYLFLTSAASAIVSLVLITIGFFSTDDRILKCGAALLIFWIITTIFFFMLSYSWKCPLCVGAVWKKNKCRRNKNAVKTLGISYRLGVALAAIFRQPYRCPYCGEKFSSSKARK